MIAVKCPLCGASAAKHLVLFHTSVWRCTGFRCRLQFAFPQLDDQCLEAEYRQSYYPESRGDSTALHKNTSVQILRQFFECLRDQLGDLSGSRLLDYGCGRGALCHLAQDYGLRATGIESNLEARAEVISRGDFAVCASLEKLRLAEPKARFDMIILWDVLEHLREPWQELGKLRGLLKPGGWLVVSTPNAKSLKTFWLRERWANYANTTHFYYFCRQSLKAVFRSSGYTELAEWRWHIRYPHHGLVRRALHHLLAVCRLHGELLFAGRLERPAGPATTLSAQPAALCATEE